MLNATVDKNEFVPKEPVDRTDTVVGEADTKRHKATKADKKEAFNKKVHDTGMRLGPTQLQDTDEDTDKKVSTVLDPQKAELAELWDAAMARNQDIQFVVQKLMPSKDPRHTTAMMLKMVSTAMYGAMCAGGMIMPMGGAYNPGLYMAQSAGGSIVMQALNGAQSRTAKKTALNETEAIMLYSMIRGVANQVVESYHDYRKYLGSVNRAWIDYQDLQAMAAECRAHQDANRQIEVEFMLRKQRRDIDSLNDDVRRSRQALADLSGSEAVDRLDKQIAIETGKPTEPEQLTTGPGTQPGADTPAGRTAEAEPDKAKPAEQDATKDQDKKTAATPGSNL